MNSKERLVSVLLLIGASQVFLGCSDSSEVVPDSPAAISIPSDLSRPSELIGGWASDKSGQELDLKEDGSAQFINHVTISAPNTGGQKMDPTVPAKWGSKDGTLYLFEVKNSPSMSYKWNLSNGKLELDTGGRIKLIYSRAKTDKKT